MLDFAKWIAEDRDRFLGVLVFIGCLCWFSTWPIRAIRGDRISDDD